MDNLTAHNPSMHEPIVCCVCLCVLLACFLHVHHYHFRVILLSILFSRKRRVCIRLVYHPCMSLGLLQTNGSV